jgi:serine/threonine protein kinase
LKLTFKNAIIYYNSEKEKREGEKMAGFPEIKGYKIISKLGQGGMAAVYLAVQKKLERKVAIKVLDQKLLKNKALVDRFEKEAKTAAMLSHSNIIQIYDTDRTGDCHYIIMEYLEKSLRDRMNVNPVYKMPPGTALKIAENLMKALDYAHFKGIYHRDIKPENIMFRQDDTPVLVDFGISRVDTLTDDMNKCGSLTGTVYYMSPEQCRDIEIDGKTDIYALGVVFFEMLTGKRPYTHESRLEVVLMHTKAPIPQLPAEVRKYQILIDQMMAKEKEKRISSAVQFDRLHNKIITGEISPGLRPAKKPSPTPVEVQTPPQPEKAPPPPEEKKPEVLPQKEPKKEKKPKGTPLINRYFNEIDKKLRAFNKNKLAPFIKKKRENLIHSAKKIGNAIKQVSLLQSLKIGVLLLVLLVIIIVLNHRPIPEPVVLNLPVSSMSVEELQNPDPRSLMDLSFARDLCELYIYKKQEGVENLEKAEEIINHMKQRKLTPEVLELVKRMAKYIDDLKLNI